MIGCKKMGNQQIQITFEYKGVSKGPYIHDLNDKMKEPCLKYTQEINKNLESIFFLFGGDKLDLDKPISKFNKENKTEIKVLVQDIPTIMLNDKEAGIHNDNLIDNDKHSNIQIRNIINNNPSHNNQNVDFQNNNNQHNINNINQNNNNTNDNTENPLSTDTVRILNIDVNFKYKSISFDKVCSPNEKLIDVSKAFCKKNGLNFNSLNFFYKNQKIDITKTFEEIADKNNKRKIKIKVEEISKNESCFKKKRK